MTLTNLILVTANSQVLLGYKKRGFGAGRWNGFGGKVLPDESMLDCAARELKEECGLVAENFEPVGVMRFYFADNGNEIEVHLFRVSNFNNEPVETEEMRPQWFYFNEIPYDKMWIDDRLWFPYFLEGKKFDAEFHFANEHKINDYKITEK